MAKSILVADASPTIRRVVELTFSGSEFHVESVDSGTRALESLPLLRPDLVLADVSMPEPSGYEVCRQVKSSRRPIPVLLLAGAFESFDEERAQACGADGYLTKPFDSALLLERVVGLLARARQWDETELTDAEQARAREVETVARAVVEHLSADVVREIAREVVPRIARRLVLERIRELEEAESE